MSKGVDVTSFKKFTQDETIKIADSINELLSEVEYKGVKLNLFLGDFIYLQVILKRFGESNQERKHYFQRLSYLSRFIARGLKNSNTNRSKVNINNKILFTLTSTKEYCTSLVFPVAARFTGEQLAFIGRDDSIVSKLSEASSYYAFDSFFSNQSALKWLSEINKIWKKLNINISALCDRYSLGEDFYSDLLDKLMTATQYFESCSSVFQKSKPRAVVTEYDRNFHNSILVSAANYFDIPTYTFIHGTINDKNAYFPFLAKNIFCWGENQFNTIKSWGVSEDSIIISGNQKIRVSNTDTNKTESIKSRFGFSNKPLITLTPNPIGISDRRKFVEGFCESVEMDSDSNYEFCIKLHPSDTKENYIDLMKKHPKIKIFDSDEITFNEMMDTTDIFVIHNSSIGVESLMFGKRVIVLDIVDVPLYNVNELVENELVEVVHSPAELFAKLSEENIVEREKVKNFLKRYYYRTNGEAAEFIAAHIN